MKRPALIRIFVVILAVSLCVTLAHVAIGESGSGNQSAVVTMTTSASIAPPPGGGGGGGGGGGRRVEVGGVGGEDGEGETPPVLYMKIHLDDDVYGYPISEDGGLQETAEVTTSDGYFTLTLPQSTIALDVDGNPLEIMRVTTDDKPHSPFECPHIIGQVYDCEPDGATFEPPITFAFTYAPESIPDDVAEEDLALAYYDEQINEWVELQSTVDLATHTVTASVSHSTTFAIIAYTPCSFSASNLSIQPATVKPKEPVTITVSVTNNGCTEGSYTAVLTINGVKESEKSVTVTALSMRDISFGVTKEDAGRYIVIIDELSGSFVVVPSVSALTSVPAPINWPLLGGIIAAVVAMALLIFFLARRGRRHTEQGG